MREMLYTAIVLLGFAGFAGYEVVHDLTEFTNHLAANQKQLTEKLQKEADAKIPSGDFPLVNPYQNPLTSIQYYPDDHTYTFLYTDPKGTEKDFTLPETSVHFLPTKDLPHITVQNKKADVYTRKSDSLTVIHPTTVIQDTLTPPPMFNVFQ